MATEAIQQWLDDVMQSSMGMEFDIRQQKLDDAFGWGEILAMLWSRMKAPQIGGVLLTGPAGCGKHHAMAHMIQQMSTDEIGCVFLDGQELTADGAAVCRQRLCQLLDYYYDEGLGLCIVLENAEDAPGRREMLTFLGRTLADYKRALLDTESSPPTPLFLILIDSGEQDIPSLLRNKLRLVRLNIPGYANRLAFLQNNGKSIRHYVSLERFAKQTKGATYTQLMDMIRNVDDLLECCDGSLQEDEFLEFLGEQMPETGRAEKQPEQDPMMMLAQSVQQIVEMLPKLVAEGGVRRQNDAPVPMAMQMQQKKMDLATDPANVTEKEIKEMSVEDLSKDLFGEELFEDIVATISAR